MTSPLLFNYSYQEFRLNVTERNFNESNNEILESIASKDETKFNVCLKRSWENALSQGYFRYKLDQLQTKILLGRYGFVAQLNVKRAKERRPPQEVDSLVMPFNAEKFNFNKIKDGEILMYINCTENPVKDESEKHAIIINASPLEYCNSLLVPSIKKCLNQVLREDGLRLAIHIMFLSANRSFRIGFNALTAYASVNHFHMHMYYLNYPLYIETAELKIISEKIGSHCYEFSEYPAEGFVFLVTIDNIEDIVKSIMKFIQYFLKNDIAHTIFMTWGQGADIASDKDVYDNVRIILWARNSVKGSKNIDVVIPALCELAGHILIKDEDTYKNIKEEEIIQLLHEACHDQFVKVKNCVSNNI